MFKIGDTVQLKSGSPLMTVTSVSDNPMVGTPGCTCMWFVDGKPEHFFFPFDALEKV